MRVLGKEARQSQLKNDLWPTQVQIPNPVAFFYAMLLDDDNIFLCTRDPLTHWPTVLYWRLLDFWLTQVQIPNPIAFFYATLLDDDNNFPSSKRKEVPSQAWNGTLWNWGGKKNSIWKKGSGFKQMVL